MGVAINNKVPIRVKTFSLGQNSAGEPSTLDVGWAALIENGIIEDPGKVEQRLGITAIDNGSSSSGSKINGLTRFQVGATIDRVYRIIGSSLQKMDDTNDGWTNIDTGFTSGTDTNFVQAKDILFILNGTDNVHSMNTSETITDEGDTNTDPPKTLVGEYMTNNRLFLAGSKTDSERDYVWYSDALDPQTFDRTVNVIKVRSGGGGKVTSLKQFRHDELIIYKEDSLFVLHTRGASPLSDWELDVLHPTIGCPAGRTVANLGNEHVFLAKEGKSTTVRLLSRTEFDKIRYGVISGPVQDILDNVNLDAISTSCAYYHNNKYVLGVPYGTATLPNYILIWDGIAALRNGNPASGWTVIPEGIWYPSCFTDYEFSDNEITLMMGENRDLSRVYKAFNGTTDNGTAIAMRVDGIKHTIDYAHHGVWSPVHVVGDGTGETELAIWASADTSSWTYIDQLSIDKDSGIDLPVNLPFNFAAGVDKAADFFPTKQMGRAKTFQLSFRHGVSGEDCTLNEYTLWVDQRG